MNWVRRVLRERQDQNQILLSIVETWRISEYPEYRGFRCANCQEYKNKAWHHWFNYGGYRLPIHLCEDNCEYRYLSGLIEVDPSKRLVLDRSLFGNTYSYSPEATDRFREIVTSWPKYKKPEIKEFACDSCNKTLNMEKLFNGMIQRQGYHVWWKMPNSEVLVELHFHKLCGNLLGVYSRNEMESRTINGR